jgi:hypothetical protein
MINTADLIPTSPADILAGFKKRAANNGANKLNDFQKMQNLANGMRKVLKGQVESYKAHVTETYLDCEYTKVKVSKRVAKVPKYARGITK